ncbi:MAG: hypothetical protein ACXVR1_00785 [Solirubrobacteraceae bacterium]
MQLYAMLPILRYSYERGAYILRFVGENRGPVLRKDRRRGQSAYRGPERRAVTVTPLIDPAQASRPSGGVRVLGPVEAGSKRPAATRRRQHGRQRPPRPRH